MLHKLHSKVEEKINLKRSTYGIEFLQNGSIQVNRFLVYFFDNDQISTVDSDSGCFSPMSAISFGWGLHKKSVSDNRLVKFLKKQIFISFFCAFKLFKLVI